MNNNEVLKNLSNSKKLICKARKQLASIPLTEILKYWHNQQNNNYKTEIEEMIECNIFPAKFADGISQLSYASTLEKFFV